MIGPAGTNRKLMELIASQLPEESAMDTSSWSGQGGEVAQVNWEGLTRAVGRRGVGDLKRGLQTPGDPSGLGQAAKDFIGGGGPKYGGTNEDIRRYYQRNPSRIF